MNRSVDRRSLRLIPSAVSMKARRIGRQAQEIAMGNETMKVTLENDTH